MVMKVIEHSSLKNLVFVLDMPHSVLTLMMLAVELKEECKNAPLARKDT